MNKSFSKIRHIQEANNNLEKRTLQEGFVSEYTKDQAKAAFNEVADKKGVVYMDPQTNQIVFQVGSRKFSIKELE